jgi:hypothetical protein
MYRSSNVCRFAPAARLAGLLALVVLAVPMALPAQATPHSAKDIKQHAVLQIPPSIRAEHEEIHQALIAATKEPDPVGSAARALAAVLHPHFVREEQIALPPLGLLAPLAEGVRDSAMLAVLPLTDSLRTELPRMLQEHGAIHAATARLGEVARAQRNAPVQRLAEQLALHAQTEEQVLYPAALLVGDMVRARIAEHRAPR